MANVISMPKLGFDMAEGTLVRWVKAEGEHVERGEILAEIETDKATVEVESAAEGILRAHLVAVNTPVPVGSPIAIVGSEDEEIDIEALVSETATPEPAHETEEESIPPGPTASSEPTLDGEALPGGVKASPIARRIAREQGINLKNIAGSGPQGRIVKRDVEQARGETVPVAGLQAARIPLSKLRGAIGRRMSAAKQELPHFYLTADLDAAPLMSVRAELNSRRSDQEKFSVNDFLVKASALALRDFPNLNASLDGDVILRHGDINIGVAVAVTDGLLTVVSHNPDSKTLPQISSDIRQMIERARSGKVHPQDIEGSTFTVSNLGMYSIDQFTAIINPPEAAILAVGSIRTEPVVEDGEIAVGKRMRVTLSADHRITDGAEAAEWLLVFREYVEHPVLMLV
jgi:pyruvate dehydrogenase E2 component (dihydrolipoamide acetyltransferase)